MEQQSNTKEEPIKKEEAMETVDNAIDSYLLSFNLFRKQVAKDGSCLFRVVSEQMYQSQAWHLIIRHKCIDFMKTNRDMFEPFIEGSFEHHMFELDKPQTWAGQVEISALSLMLKQDIIIYQVGCQPQNVTGNGFDKQISLCYSNGNHYDAVYPLGFKTNAAMVQSLLYEFLITTVFPNLPLTDEASKDEESPSNQGELSMDDKIKINLPDSIHNKEVFWKMKRSLDPTFYRNIDLEVWRHEQTDLQQIDRNMALVLQLRIGDTCLAYLKQKDGGKTLHAVTVNSMSADQKIFQVTTCGTHEQFKVNPACLRVEGRDLVYKQLPGYYQKNNESEKIGNTRNDQPKKRNRGGQNRQNSNGEAKDMRNLKNTNKKNGKGTEQTRKVRNSKNRRSKETDDKQPLSDSNNNTPQKTDILDNKADNFPTIEETHDPRKVAQDAESPAAFWGRMRDGKPSEQSSTNQSPSSHIISDANQSVEPDLVKSETGEIKSEPLEVTTNQNECVEEATDHTTGFAEVTLKQEDVECKPKFKNEEEIKDGDLTKSATNHPNNPPDNDNAVLEIKQQTQRKLEKKSVSFGSTTEIECKTEQDESLEVGEDSGKVPGKVPGKIVIPTELRDMCQASSEDRNRDDFSRHIPNGGLKQNVPNQHQQFLPPAAFHPAFPSVYPFTGVLQPYNFQQSLSKEEDGKDLPYEDLATLRHYFNLGVIYHNNILQTQQLHQFYASHAVHGVYPPPTTQIPHMPHPPSFPAQMNSQVEEAQLPSKMQELQVDQPLNGLSQSNDQIHRLDQSNNYETNQSNLQTDRIDQSNNQAQNFYSEQQEQRSPRQDTDSRQPNGIHHSEQQELLNSPSNSNYFNRNHGNHNHSNNNYGNRRVAANPHSPSSGYYQSRTGGHRNYQSHSNQRPYQM